MTIFTQLFFFIGVVFFFFSFILFLLWMFFRVLVIPVRWLIGQFSAKSRNGKLQKKYFFVLIFLFSCGSIPQYALADCSYSNLGDVTGTAGFGHANMFLGGGARVAARFVPECTGTIESVTVKMDNYNSPADAVVIDISPDSSGYPSNSELGTSDEINPPSSAGELEATYATPVNVSEGSTYYFVARRTGEATSANFYDWAFTSGDYLAYTDGGSWTHYTDRSPQISFTIIESSEPPVSTSSPQLSTTSPDFYNGTIHQETPLNIIWALFWGASFYFVLQVSRMFLG